MTNQSNSTQDTEEGVMPEIDWNAAANLIRHKLEMALARHPSVGAALTFSDGEKLITTLSSNIIYDIRKLVDPSYDA